MYAISPQIIGAAGTKPGSDHRAAAVVANPQGSRSRPWPAARGDHVMFELPLWQMAATATGLAGPENWFEPVPTVW
jgi:hypothetical protein